MKFPSSPEFPHEPEGAACAAARESLQRRLDREAESEAAEVLRHRASCPACASWESAARFLENGLRLSVPLRPPAGLANRILAEMTAAPLRRRRRVGLVAAGLALAAGVFLAVVAIEPWKQKPDQVVVVPRPKVEPAPPSPELRPSPLGKSLDEAEWAVASLTRQAAEQTRLMPWPSLQLPDVTDAGGPLEKLEPAASSIEEVRHSAVLGIAPITDSARRAADMFWRELGPDNDRKPAIQ